MTVLERPDEVATTVEPRGFRPGSRRRARILGGVALVLAAVGGNVLAYSSLDHRSGVIQVVTDIRAGESVTADALRVVEADLDPAVPAVLADELDQVVGQYARVHIASGSLLAPVLVQPTPLVAEDSAVVAVEVRPTLVPTGVRERSAVVLIVPTTGDVPTFRALGRVVTRPTTVDAVTGLLTMSVEVATADAEPLAAADDIRVVLVEPTDDPVYGSGG
jgi:hypothetical protein